MRRTVHYFHARVKDPAFWALVSKNLVVPGSHAKGGMEKLPWVSITEYGVKCFEEGKILPYDPQGFLKTLYADVPNIDQITKLYLEEAVNCFSNTTYLSSAVMIGCALEKNIIDTTEAFYSNLNKNKSIFKNMF